MAPYDRGYFGRPGGRGRDWSDPYGDVSGTPYRREHAGSRPWVGGYQHGYQGGSGGVPTRGHRYGGDFQGRSRPGGEPRRGAHGGSRYGGDYWWIGEHAYRNQDPGYSYDEAYRRFDEQARPRYSPVGGNYHAMGGSYAYNRPPRPLREDTWFSDWTRWF